MKKGKLVLMLSQTVETLAQQFNSIPVARRNELLGLAEFIKEKIDDRVRVNLNFICTHNSRRSHMAQIWAQTAAHYYGIHQVQCYSGGTEETEFNPKAIEAMRHVGFEIQARSDGMNPIYEVLFSHETKPVIAFSKKYDDVFNPAKDFVAVMTCSQADANCPLVTGATKRIAITYQDPKDFDGTSQETEKYRERALQIGKEMLFAFSKISRPSR